jgi:hypothetical protein
MTTNIVQVRVPVNDKPCGVDLCISDEELALPYDALDARILAPARKAFNTRWPGHASAFNAELARQIGKLGVAA